MPLNKENKTNNQISQHLKNNTAVWYLNEIDTYID